MTALLDDATLRRHVAETRALGFGGTHAFPKTEPDTLTRSEAEDADDDGFDVEEGRRRVYAEAQARAAEALPSALARLAGIRAEGEARVAKAAQGAARANELEQATAGVRASQRRLDARLAHLEGRDARR
jgi:hypothetical protein